MTKTEPVALYAAFAVVAVWAASLLGVVLETGVVENLIVSVVIAVTAILQRSKVTPTG